MPGDDFGGKSARKFLSNFSKIRNRAKKDRLFMGTGPLYEIALLSECPGELELQCAGLDVNRLVIDCCSYSRILGELVGTLL